MLAGRISALLCISAALSATAKAEPVAFVTQLQLPARGTSLDVFAWREAGEVLVEGRDLASLGVAAPDSSEPIALSSIEGLTYTETPGAAAIILSCNAHCYATQHVAVGQAAGVPERATARGGYVNYEAELQWVESDAAQAFGVADAVLFGEWGLVRSSWLARTEGTQATRLETSWTIDRPRDGVRIRLGDGVVTGVGGAPVRFGGVQIGRHFGLTPSLVTYPTPALGGEAESASIVELYVDGALRTRSQVAAGPFVIDHAPLVSGAGEAELVVTDLLGRQHTITRPFFVSTTLLRRGLFDWSVAAGAERQHFGRISDDYGDGFAAARYRVGATEALTLDIGAEHARADTTLSAGAAFLLGNFGQAALSHAANRNGEQTTAGFTFDADHWTFGMQTNQRSSDFRILGRHGDTSFRRSAAANLALDLGGYGALALTATDMTFDNEADARTLAISYAPDFAPRLSFRMLHTQHEESELSAGVSFSVSLGANVSGHLSAESGRRGATYRASAHRSPAPRRLGWRAQAAFGSLQRLDAAVQTSGALGDSMAQAAYVNGRGGVRLRHRGSVGWIEDIPFAGPSIEGGFAIADADASDVGVTRNRLQVGTTGANGHLLVTGLRPYDANAIAIETDDLPLDRAPAAATRWVAPSEGAGAVVRFADAHERLIETRVRYTDGETPPRGAVMVRRRDNARFPIGGGGRIVLRGARPGDVLVLDGAAECTAEVVAGELTLMCAA